MGVRDLSMIGMQLPEGMSHAQFNNNPGNIKAAHPNGKPTDYANYLKEIGVPFEVGTKAKDGGYFFHFPDAKTGYEAAQRFWLETKDWMVWDYGGMTLDQALRKYSGGGYDIEKLQEGAGGRIDDINGSTNIMEITDEQWARIMNEQTRWEDVNYYNKIKEENISVNINGRLYDYQRADGTTATTDAGSTVDQDIPDLGKTEKTDKTEKKDKKLGTVTQEMIDYMGDSGADLGKRLQDETDDPIEVKKEYETLEEFYGDFVGPDGTAVYIDEENAQNAIKPGDAVRIGGKLFGVAEGGLILIQENGNFPADQEKQQVITYRSIQDGTANLDDMDISLYDSPDENQGEPATYDLSDDERTILGDFTIDGSVGEGEAAVKDKNGNVVAKIKGNQLIGVDGNNEVPLGTYVDNGDGTYSFKKGPLYNIAMARATDEQKKVVETFQKTAENNPNFAKTIINASQGTDTLSGDDLVTAASTLPAAEGQPETRTITTSDPRQQVMVTKLEVDQYYTIAKGASSKGDNVIGGQSGVVQLVKIEGDRGIDKVYTFVNQRTGETFQVNALDLLAQNALLEPTQYELDNKETFEFGENERIVVTDKETGDEYVLGEEPDGTKDTTKTDEDPNKTDVKVETTDDGKGEGFQTAIENAGAIGQSLLQTASSVLDGIGGPGAIISYVMGKQGLDAAMKEIEPMQKAELSPMFMQHLRQSRELSKRGFHPDQEREFQNELDKAYQIGLENAVRGTGGDRAKYLAQSGVLDAQRSAALIDYAAKDAELQNANLEKYENMMLFKENFDIQRTEEQRTEDLERQIKDKEAAAGFVGSAFSSLMNSYASMNTNAIMQNMGQGLTNLFNPISNMQTGQNPFAFLNQNNENK